MGGGVHSEKIGFTYYTLGNKLFDKNGLINPNCTFEQLANHIFFTETNKPLSQKKSKNILLGESDGIYIYMIFYGMGKKNVLDFKTMKSLPKDTKKIIYADWCNISTNRLEEYNIEFKQIPYELKVF